MLFLPVLAALLSLGLGSAQAAQSTKAKATNSKQAAGLQAAAVYLKPVNKGYIFTNVGTGQRLTYVPKGNRIYPAKGRGSAIKVQQFSNKKVPWHRLSFGAKNKCFSSAWGGRVSGNNAAVAYVCASGSNAKKTTLERTKQWWLLVPTSRPLNAKAKQNSYANGLLLAAQGDSIATRNQKIAAQQAAFDRRMRLRRRTSEVGLRKRAKSAGVGTYYIIPTDHLMDMPARALTGKSVTSRGIKSTTLTVWKNGNKNQQWRITLA